MNMVPPSLPDSTIMRVRSGWAAIMECSPDVLQSRNKIVIARQGSLRVIALNLLGSVVVNCPPKLVSLLAPLSSVEVMDMSVLLHILASSNPDPIGTATISYVDSETLTCGVDLGSTYSPNIEEFNEVMGSATQSEQEECGLTEMPFRFAVKSKDGRPAALAGYEVWNSHIAQMGALTAAGNRGLGYGFTVSAAAASAAITADLIPQWRCRIDNEPSQQLGRQLGFVPLGRQLGLALTSSE